MKLEKERKFIRNKALFRLQTLKPVFQRKVRNRKKVKKNQLNTSIMKNNNFN